MWNIQFVIVLHHCDPLIYWPVYPVGGNAQNIVNGNIIIMWHSTGHYVFYPTDPTGASLLWSLGITVAIGIIYQGAWLILMPWACFSDMQVSKKSASYLFLQCSFPNAQNPLAKFLNQISPLLENHSHNCIVTSIFFHSLVLDDRKYQIKIAKYFYPTENVEKCAAKHCFHHWYGFAVIKILSTLFYVPWT